MAIKSDYRVRKCTDKLFRVFTAGEVEIMPRSLVPEKYWMNGDKPETGFETRSEALASLDKTSYSTTRIS